MIDKFELRLTLDEAVDFKMLCLRKNKAPNEIVTDLIRKFLKDGNAECDKVEKANDVNEVIEIGFEKQ